MKYLFTFLLLIFSSTSIAQFCYEDNDGDGYVTLLQKFNLVFSVVP